MKDILYRIKDWVEEGPTSFWIVVFSMDSISLILSFIVIIHKLAK